MSTLSLVSSNSLPKYFSQLLGEVFGDRVRVFGFSNLWRWIKNFLCTRLHIFLVSDFYHSQIFLLSLNPLIFLETKRPISVLLVWNQGVSRITFTVLYEGVHPLRLPYSETTFLSSWAHPPLSKLASNLPLCSHHHISFCLRVCPIFVFLSLSTMLTMAFRATQIIKENLFISRALT